MRLQDTATLCVHLLGMTIGSEYVGFEKYLEILHCLPALKRLNICMIGPETDHHLMVPMQVPCRDAQGNKSCILNISIHLAFYHDFATLGKFTQPDLVLGLNVGLHEQPFSHMTANTWLPTLQLLVDKSIPTVFTSFTHGAHLVHCVHVACMSCACINHIVCVL